MEALFVQLTDIHLKDENDLKIIVDNSVNDVITLKDYKIPVPECAARKIILLSLSGITDSFKIVTFSSMLFLVSSILYKLFFKLILFIVIVPRISVLFLFVFILYSKSLWFLIIGKFLILVVEEVILILNVIINKTDKQK